jgi:hypothetical protein
MTTTILARTNSQSIDTETIAAYLPDNYRVLGRLDDGDWVIVGTDVAGWTADDYVIPRLASTLVAAERVE